jgi:AraC-like DNA-binding protein
MNGVETSLYSVASALCVFSAGLLRGRAGVRSKGEIYFTAFLVIEALSFICEVLMAHPATPLKCVWLGGRMGLSLLIAPCLWLVIRESSGPRRPKLTELGKWHWIAVVAGIGCLIPLWSSAHWGTDYPNPLRPVSWFYSKVIHTGMLSCVGIFVVQVPWYLRRSQRLLAEKSRSPRWLQWPLAVVLTTWLLGLLRVLQCISHAPQELSLLISTIEVSVTVGALYFIVRQSSTAEPAPTAPAAKYARSSLDAATIARIKRKIETALSAPEVSSDSLLNLRSLSRTIGEKAHYVSQVINQELGTNFYELLSRHRIARAKTLLRERRDQTVLEIALAVGFNSKSTFNAAFRKEVGMTPTAFRADGGDTTQPVARST